MSYQLGTRLCPMHQHPARMPSHRVDSTYLLVDADKYIPSHR